MAEKKVLVVCNLNSSRSQLIEDFLRGKYGSEIDVNSAGIYVNRLREDDPRTPLTVDMLDDTDPVLATESENFYRIRYDYLHNDERIGKVHNLRIPDVFLTHPRAFISDPKIDYDEWFEITRNHPEFQALRKYVASLDPRQASDLVEALYIRDQFSARQEKLATSNLKYPNDLLFKALEYRFPKIDRIIRA